MLCSSDSTMGDSTYSSCAEFARGKPVTAMHKHVGIVKSDQCAFGLTTPVESKQDRRPAKKSTKCTSNSNATLST